MYLPTGITVPKLIVVGQTGRKYWDPRVAPLKVTQDDRNEQIDRVRVTSYYRPVATMSLSYTVSKYSEILAEIVNLPHPVFS